MPPTTIPISSILLEDRKRIDYTDNDGIKDSLSRFGTIQPLVLEPRPDGTYRLVAGGRRLKFLTELGHTTLYHASTYDAQRPGYVLGAELSKDQMHELELEENIRRKAMSWQEQAIAIADLHALKSRRNAMEGAAWGVRQTGELLGVSKSHVGYAISFARHLSDPSSPLWKMDTALQASQWLLQQQENAALAEKARRMADAAALEVDSSLPDLSDLLSAEPATVVADPKEEARQRYLSNPLNPPEQFELYYEQKQALDKRKLRIPITPRLHLGSCLDFLQSHPATFDHIITDPPYAIDMANLSQANLGLSNIDTVADQHTVDGNLYLLSNFFLHAYSALKESGFLVLWADYSMWDFLCQHADRAGFSVQRWPVVWVKTHTCLNSMAHKNFTKTTEIALVCRKGNATLAKAGPAGHIIASHDEYKDRMQHPFVKPFAVWEHLIEAVSIKGQTILDPFAGEGSCILSLIRLERNFFGCEIEAHHYNRLLENVKQEYLRINPEFSFI